MSNLWLVYGELRFPTGGVARWRAGPVDPGSFPESDEPDLDIEVMSVDDVLASLPDELVAGDAIDVRLDGDTVTVRGAVGDDDLGAWQLRLAPALRTAAAHAATGEIFLADTGGRDAERLTIGSGSSRFDAVTLDRSPLEILGWAESFKAHDTRLQAMSSTPAKPRVRAKPAKARVKAKRAKPEAKGKPKVRS